MFLLLHAQRGAIGLAFGMMLMPMLGCIGLAIDYGFAVQAQTQLNVALDNAALAASRAAAQAYSANPSSNWVKAGTDVANSWLKITTSNLAYVTATKYPDPQVVQVGSNINATVSYAGTMNTYVAGVLGFKTLNVASSSIASTAISQTSDFYFLLDDSGSMGIPFDRAEHEDTGEFGRRSEEQLGGRKFGLRLGMPFHKDHGSPKEIG